MTAGEGLPAGCTEASRQAESVYDCKLSQRARVVAFQVCHANSLPGLTSVPFPHHINHNRRERVAEVGDRF